MTLSRIRLFAALAIGSLALCAAGCTPGQEQAAATGVSVLCTSAAVGSTIYVQVEANNGATAQNISKQVQSGVSTGCPAIVAATQATVGAITAAGQTATVTVSTASPNTAKLVLAKFKLRGVGAKRSLTFVVKPLSSGIPVVSDLINKLGSL